MNVVQEVESLVAPALKQNRFELVETQYRRESGRWVLRLFIDKTGKLNDSGRAAARASSVTLDDCEKVSHLVGGILDGAELISDAYTLEVSSPGINRPLRTPEHFARYAGEKVKVSCFSPLSPESKQKNFSGPLLGVKGESIEMEDLVSGKVSIPLSAIAKAHLDII